jgi:hypothetical protein
MIHAVSRRPLTSDKRLQSQTVSVGFVRNKLALEQISVRVLECFPVSIIPPTPHTHSYIPYWHYRKLATDSVIK